MERLRTIPGGMLVGFVIGLADSLIVWGLASLFDVDVLIPESPGSEALAPISLLPIVVVVAAATIGAGVLLWSLERFLPGSALATFQIVAVVALAVSLISPLMLDQDVEAKLALVAMHLLVGSAIIGALTWVGTAPGRLRVEQAIQD
jgi:Family of unknown function (DUF6069)